MQDHETYTDTIQEVYNKLAEIIQPDAKKFQELLKTDDTFPKNCNKLRRDLNKIKTNLIDFNIQFTIAPYHQRDGVNINFQKVDKVRSPASQPTPEPAEDGNGDDGERGERPQDTFWKTDTAAPVVDEPVLDLDDEVL
jgi:hypothetical protein